MNNKFCLLLLVFMIMLSWHFDTPECFANSKGYIHMPVIKDNHKTHQPEMVIDFDLPDNVDISKSECQLIIQITIPGWHGNKTKAFNLTDLGYFYAYRNLNQPTFIIPLNCLDGVLINCEKYKGEYISEVKIHYNDNQGHFQYIFTPVYFKLKSESVTSTFIYFSDGQYLQFQASEQSSESDMAKVKNAFINAKNLQFPAVLIKSGVHYSGGDKISSVDYSYIIDSSGIPIPENSTECKLLASQPSGEVKFLATIAKYLVEKRLNEIGETLTFDAIDKIEKGTGKQFFFKNVFTTRSVKLLLNTANTVDKPVRIYKSLDKLINIDKEISFNIDKRELKRGISLISYYFTQNPNPANSGDDLIESIHDNASIFCFYPNANKHVSEIGLCQLGLAASKQTHESAIELFSKGVSSLWDASLDVFITYFE